MLVKIRIKKTVVLAIKLLQIFSLKKILKNLNQVIHYSNKIKCNRQANKKHHSLNQQIEMLINQLIQFKKLRQIYKKFMSHCKKLI